MLNLRNETSSLHAQSTAQISTMRFDDRIIGNMGQSLRFGPEDDDVDEDYRTDQELEFAEDREDSAREI
jgi:hypothetical protein